VKGVEGEGAMVNGEWSMVKVEGPMIIYQMPDGWHFPLNLTASAVLKSTIVLSSYQSHLAYPVI